MAEPEYKQEGLFARLGKLFQSSIILRQTPAGKKNFKE